MKRGMKKNWLVIADILVSIVIFALLAVFRPDFLLVASFILICIYLYLTNRGNAFYHLLISSIIALIWVIIARNYYAYNQKTLVLLGINLFPLFAWALGLFCVYILYSHWEHKLREENYVGKTLLFLTFYWPLLIIGEAVAYNFFNIQDLATSMYSGLPLCGCMHAPIWMQASYFALGPLYFLICELFNLENPNSKLW